MDILVVLGLLAVPFLLGASSGRYSASAWGRLLFWLWASTPLLLWLALGAKNGCVLPSEEESCRTDFAYGLLLVLMINPIWAALAWLGYSVAKRPVPQPNEE